MKERGTIGVLVKQSSESPPVKEAYKGLTANISIILEGMVPPGCPSPVACCTQESPKAVA